MAYKRYYTDETILELCKKFNIEPDNIDSKAIEQKMLTYYESHQAEIKKQNIDEIEKNLLLNLQRLGANLAENPLLKEVAQYHGILLESHITEKK